MKRNLKAPGVLLPDWFYLGLLSVFLVLFHWKVLFQGQVFAALDSSRFFFPVWKWGWEVFQQGRIPLWNPDAQFGVPYLADPQTACAYAPLWILYALLGPVSAFSAVIVLHHAWALLGFWVFAREQAFSPATAFFGALTFGFSLHLVGSSWTPPALMAMSWLPWVFWAAEKVFRKTPGGFLLLSFTWAMQLACGYPVLVYLTGLGLGMHYLWRSVPTREFSWLARFLTAAAVAVAYNLAWGLPFAEMLPLTNYAEGAKRFHDLGLRDLMTFLNPFPQGHPLEPNDHGTPYWAGSFFMGLPVLGLLVWGAWRKSFQRTSLWLFILLLALSLGSLGIDNRLRAVLPDYSLRDVLPGYSLVVHSGFWISILVLYASWMSMEVLERILRNGSGRGRWVWGALTLVTVLSLGPTANGLLMTKEKAFYQEPPKVLAVLDKPGRLFFTPPEMAKAVRAQGANIGEAYETAKQSCIPNWPLAFGREVAPFYNTLRISHSFAWTFDAFQQSEAHSRKVLDYLGIRYVFGRSKFKDLKAVQGAEVFENPQVRFQWFMVSKARAAGTSLEEDFGRAAKEGMGYGKECFIADPSKSGSYRIRKIGEGKSWPGRWGMNILDDGKALLASSETAYPGWKVMVFKDGHWNERTVETINHAFRGVVLEEGEKKVDFIFEPNSFRLGLFFSLLVCGFWGCSLLRIISPFEKGGPRGN